MAGVRRQVGRPSRGSHGNMGGLSVPLFFFWTIFLVSTAIAYLWIYNQNDVVSSRLSETRTLILETENTNRELQAAIDRLSSIERITGIARKQLSMYVPPAETLIVYVPEFHQ
ncbi:MAG: cell division protein FtsL [Candidatus Marinimicrobia bacterium]|nr:cell division protein FtsL [Candidatus Neomarinimicrobiota bacterium]